MIKKDVELYGRKTFFIVPDASLIPKTYLEEFFENGYETYIINDDYTCSIQTKVREITKLFPGSILYFNIDATISGIEWKSYIRELSEFFGDENLIGIFYSSKQNPEDEEKIKKYYIEQLDIKAGCFALSARNHDNFESILKVLEKTGARGRRNNVRANCDSSSFVQFNYDGQDFNAQLLDINISHFRCNLPSSTSKFQIFDKVRRVKLSFADYSFVSDAVLIMKRDSEGKNLCIFMFIKKDDMPDLEQSDSKLLNQKIYQIVLNENMDKLQNVFKTADK
ncbi:hypothetical protein [Treponema sp.]|uniref:hypothetical protein n=1 Tax=Treponema sp. TaxID=166 RepID=UPI00388D1FD7